MRVTKKLSATHAIGKCCFKKRGELLASERGELDEARRAFLASVEPRRRPSGSGGQPATMPVGAPARKSNVAAAVETPSARGAGAFP